MMEESIGVKIDTSEVRHGKEYKGSISFGNHKFHYELNFDVTPDELDRIADLNYEEARRCVYLHIIDTNGNPVTLDDRLQTFFVLSTSELAFGLYRNPQRRELSDISSATYPILHPEQYPALTGMGLNFGMEREFQIPTSPEFKKFLDDYKE